MTVTRIYSITPTDANATPEPRLIEASSKGQALRHATASMFAVKVASGKDVATGTKAGIEVEVAGSEPESEGPGEDAEEALSALNPAAAWPFPK